MVDGSNPSTGTELRDRARAKATRGLELFLEGLRPDVRTPVDTDYWLRRQPATQAVVAVWPERTLVACSGGVDSSALVVLAASARRRGAIGHAVVVHVDHRARQHSEIEADHVAALCGVERLPFVRVTVDCRDAGPAGASPEERMRAMRYSALTRVAGRLGMDSVVTAHTLDDQVETILMRLLAGSGGVASAGMAREQVLETTAGTIRIVRPLLDTRRQDLFEVLAHAGVTPLADPSNTDRRFRRNALRHDVVPILRDEFGRFDRALTRSVELAARDARLVDHMADEAFARVATTSETTTVIPRTWLVDQDAALGSRIVRLAAMRLLPDNPRELTFERVESVLIAARGRTGAIIELPYGIIVRVQRDNLTFDKQDAPS